MRPEVFFFFLFLFHSQDDQREEEEEEREDKMRISMYRMNKDETVLREEKKKNVVGVWIIWAERYSQSLGSVLDRCSIWENGCTG